MTISLGEEPPQAPPFDCNDFSAYSVLVKTQIGFGFLLRLGEVIKFSMSISKNTLSLRKNRIFEF